MARLPRSLSVSKLAAALAAAVASLLDLGLALAEEAGHAAVEHGAEHPEGGAGMPQLDASTYISQIFWLIVAFGTLYYLLKTKALPRVAEILETRQDRIANDLDRAARLRAEAEEAARKHETVVLQAQTDAQQRLREAQERHAAEMARAQAALDADLGKKLDEAERRIGRARQEALGHLAEVAADVVQTAVRKLAGIEISAEEARAVVDRVATEQR